MDAKELEQAILMIREGKVGVMPTDTIYGLVASIKDQSAVERIYDVKQRDSSRPCVVLISSEDQLSDLDIDFEYEMREALDEIWPGPNSVILPTAGPQYLHRDTWSLAVRLPAIDWLNEIIDLTGPLVATSANPSGTKAIQKIDWIMKHLPGLDFYYEGRVQDKPSTLYRYDNGALLVEDRQ